MFARSVSPLRREWLKVISEDLYHALMEYAGGGSRSRKGRKEEAVKPETRILLGGRYFNIKTVKGGKKIVDLPWNELKPVINDIRGSELKRYRKLRGRVLLDEGEFLSRSKISRIIKTCRLIDPQKSITDKMPAAFYTGGDFDESTVFSGVDHILHLYRRGRKKRGTVLSPSIPTGTEATGIQRKAV